MGRVVNASRRVRTLVPIVQRAGWVLGLVWTGHRGSNPDRPDRNESLYWRYAGRFGSKHVTKLFVNVSKTAALGHFKEDCLDNIVKCQHNGYTNPYSDKFIQFITQTHRTGGDIKSPSKRIQQSLSTFVFGVGKGKSVPLEARCAQRVPGS